MKRKNILFHENNWSYWSKDNFSFSFCVTGGSHSNDASIKAKIRWYTEYLGIHFILQSSLKVGEVII